MSQYRKKPVVIEAFQMTQERRNDNKDWPDWLNYAWQVGAAENGLFINPGDPERQRLCIGTLEGVYHVTWGDWIIRGVKGEIYPCKPDIFEATYEPASAAPSAQAALEACEYAGVDLSKGKTVIADHICQMQSRINALEGAAPSAQEKS